ncbi:MAG: hypothetical protein ABI905_05080 [Betaproteobacteria bacterium]
MKKSVLKAVVSTVAVSLTLMGLSAPAFADVTPEDISRFVTMYDVNKDGMLSRTEVMKRASDMFDKMDKSKKGMLDDKKAMAFLLELQKTDGYTPGRMMSKADMMKKMEMMFDKVDTGKKGMLDKKQAEIFFRELMKSDG